MVVPSQSALLEFYYTSPYLELYLVACVVEEACPESVSGASYASEGGPPWTREQAREARSSDSFAVFTAIRHHPSFNPS